MGTTLDNSLDFLCSKRCEAVMEYLKADMALIELVNLTKPRREAIDDILDAIIDKEVPIIMKALDTDKLTAMSMCVTAMQCIDDSLK